MREIHPHGILSFFWSSLINQMKFSRRFLYFWILRRNALKCFETFSVDSDWFLSSLNLNISFYIRIQSCWSVFLISKWLGVFWRLMWLMLAWFTRWNDTLIWALRIDSRGIQIKIVTLSHPTKRAHFRCNITHEIYSIKTERDRAVWCCELCVYIYQSLLFVSYFWCAHSVSLSSCLSFSHISYVLIVCMLTVCVSR